MKSTASGTFNAISSHTAVPNSTLSIVLLTSLHSGFLGFLSASTVANMAIACIFTSAGTG